MNIHHVPDPSESTDSNAPWFDKDEDSDEDGTDEDVKMERMRDEED